MLTDPDCEPPSRDVFNGGERSTLLVVGDFRGARRHGPDDPSVAALTAAARRRRGRLIDRADAHAAAPARGLDREAIDRRPSAGARRDGWASTRADDAALWAFQRINQAYALAACAAAAPNATVVVYGEDLHLVPALIRQARPDVRIGLLLDDEFLTPTEYRLLPNRLDLLAGLLGSDLIGLPSRPGANRLIEVMRLDGRAARGRLPVTTETYVGVFPPSADTNAVRILAERPDVQARAAVLRARSGDPARLLLTFADPTEPGPGIGPDELRQIGRPTTGPEGADRALVVIGGPDLGDLAVAGGMPVYRAASGPDLAERVAWYLAADVFLTAGAIQDDVRALEFVAARDGRGMVVRTDQPATSDLQAADAVRDAHQLVAGYDCHSRVRMFLAELRWRQGAVVNRRPLWPTNAGRVGVRPVHS